MSHRFHRFATLDLLAAKAIDLLVHSADASDDLVAGIYTDDSITHRPQLEIWNSDGTVDVLRWNAFCDEFVDHMGKRARVEAREHAERIRAQILAARNGTPTPTPAPYAEALATAEPPVFRPTCDHRREGQKAAIALEMLAEALDALRQSVDMSPEMGGEALVHEDAHNKAGRHVLSGVGNWIDQLGNTEKLRWTALAIRASADMR